MNKSLVAFPSTISTQNFSNFLGTCEPSCLLPHELHFVMRFSSLQTPATHRTVNAMHSRVADKGLNLKDFPARGILGMLMNEVLLHFHLQLVSLYTSSDLWPNSLCFQLADFLFYTHVFNKEEKSSPGGLPARNSGCSRFCTRRSSALSSPRLKSHIVPLVLAFVKSTTNPSRKSRPRCT